jgi:simple sugar transport system permease protein
VALGFKAGLFNIGAEGQFFMGALGASAMILTGIVNASWSTPLAILACGVAGIAAGAVWGAIPGFLKAKMGVNEIIGTLMMNYIAVYLVNFFVFAVWSDKGFQMSPVFPRNTWLPRLSDYVAQVPEFRGLTTHFGLGLGLIAVGVGWFIV